MSGELWWGPALGLVLGVGLCLIVAAIPLG